MSLTDTVTPNTAPDRRSQSLRVRDAVRDEICQAILRPGDIVIEPQLAELYGVSKTPVREALQMLSVEGYVTIMPRKGYMVSTLGYSDIREVMDLRLILEPPLFAAAARNTDTHLVGLLRTLIERQFDPASELAVRLEAASEFHLACVRASRNERAASIVRRLTNETSRLHYLFPGVEAHVTSDPEREAHESILQAISDGDPDRARNAIHDHLVESNAAMVREFY